MASIERHEREIQANLRAWQDKPLLRDIYAGFYQRIRAQLDLGLDGAVVEIGSGIGNLKQGVPEALCSDLFANPWLDLVCDGYALPFRDGAVSNLVLFDVFHHLRRPLAFLAEARRVLVARGRLILFEPYISPFSALAYGLFHHEPIAWRQPLDSDDQPDRSGTYYAAQGNATRIFFRNGIPTWSDGWVVRERRAFADCAYLLSGGFSKRALYRREMLPRMQKMDRLLSRLPGLFASRCLLCLQKNSDAHRLQRTSAGH
jgi:SAM-dependent methyltransferase